MHRKILIATTNAGKIYEYKYVLAQQNLPITFVFLNDLNADVPAPDETGATYEENALIKAEYYFNHFKIPVISDDSGMEISVLGNVPGIHTARFLNDHKDNTFQKINELVRAKDPKSQNKEALFYCCAIYKDKDSSIIANARKQGIFTFPPKGSFNKSFGYDPVFKLLELNKTLAEIDTETKLRYSPRVTVIKEILEKLGQQ
jgi:XTP/dITP diphosphohydrolase